MNTKEIAEHLSISTRDITVALRKYYGSSVRSIKKNEVFDVEQNIVYESPKEAAKNTGVSIYSVYNHLNGYVINTRFIYK